MRTRLVSLLAMFALSACGGPDCWYKGHCQLDLVPVQQSVPACSEIMDGVCGDPFRDYLSCLDDHETCDDQGHGTFDVDPCKQQALSLEICCHYSPKQCGG